VRVRVSHRPLLVSSLVCGSGSVVEHLLAKEKVAGSIPVSRSRFAYIRGEHKHTFGREFVSLVGKCNMQPALHRSQFVAGY
jgi:hypothetical protein